MESLRQHVSTWAALGLLTISGCTAGRPPMLPSANPPGLAGDQLPTAGDSWSQSVAAAAVSAPSGGAFLAPLERAMGSVADAFRIEPTVVPPNDPVSLASQPRSVGPDLHFRAGQVYESQGNLAAAVACYEKALDIDPCDFRTLLGCGRLYDRQSDFHQAESFYQRAIGVQPNNSAALNDLGMCYARQGSLDAAVSTLERAVLFQPDDPLYRNNLAMALVDCRRLDEAFQQLSAVHGAAGAHYNLGFLLSRRGMPDLARQHFERALQIDPGLTPARQMLARLDTETRPETYGPGTGGSALASSGANGRSAPLPPSFGPGRVGARLPTPASPR